MTDRHVHTPRLRRHAPEDVSFVDRPRAQSVAGADSSLILISAATGSVTDPFTPGEGTRPAKTAGAELGADTDVVLAGLAVG